MALSLIMALAILAAVVAHVRRWMRRRRAGGHPFEHTGERSAPPWRDQQPPRPVVHPPSDPRRFMTDPPPSPAHPRTIRIERSLQPIFVATPGDRLMVDGLLAAPDGDTASGAQPGIPATLVLSARTHPLVAAASARLLQQWAEEGQTVGIAIEADPRGARALLTGPRNKLTLELDDVVAGSPLR